MLYVIRVVNLSHSRSLAEYASYQPQYYVLFMIKNHETLLFFNIEILLSLSLSLSLCEILVRDSQIIFFLLDPLLSIWLSKMYGIRLNKQERRNEYDTSIVRVRALCVKKTRGSEMK